MPLRRLATVSVAAIAALTLAACQGGAEPEPTASQPASGPTLRLLVGGTTEQADALQQQVDAWSEESGSAVRIVLATDLDQQLAESFANANPPDVFALPTTALERYDGYLEPYGTFADAAALEPSLLDVVADGGELQCVPRSADALTLAISETAWADAGLTDADVPTTWEQLESIAARLTTGDRAGLAIDPDADHLGVLLAQAGGALVDETGVIADSEVNAHALDRVVRMLDAGSLVLPDDSGAAAELASGAVAMAYADLGELLAAEVATPASAEPADGAEPSDGDEPTAAPSEPATSPQPSASDAPADDVDGLLDGIRLVPLPAGPTSAASFASATCWALPADTRTGDAARALIAFLTQDAQQLALAEATGTVPVTTTAGEAFATQHPELGPVVAALDDATTPAAALGPAEATAALDETLATLASADAGGADVRTLLADLQQRLEQQQP